MRGYKIDLRMYSGKIREIVGTAVQEKLLKQGLQWSGSGAQVLGPDLVTLIGVHSAGCRNGTYMYDYTDWPAIGPKLVLTAEDFLNDKWPAPEVKVVMKVAGEHDLEVTLLDGETLLVGNQRGGRSYALRDKNRVLIGSYEE